jgi:hypothetical protein
MTRMVADFQTVEDDGRVVLSAEDVTEAVFLLPRVGDRVLLDDEDGHTCEAVLESVEGELWTLVLDWATWVRTDGPSVVAAKGWRPALIAVPRFAS